MSGDVQDHNPELLAALKVLYPHMSDRDIRTRVAVLRQLRSSGCASVLWFRWTFRPPRQTPGELIEAIRVLGPKGTGRFDA